MKLKKIASLALAGIMAVSMLAGCNGSGENSEEENNQTVPATGVATYANDGLDALKDDLTFSASSWLDSKIQEIATNTSNFPATGTSGSGISDTYALRRATYNATMTGKVEDALTDNGEVVIAYNSLNTARNDTNARSFAMVFTVSGSMDQESAIKTALSSSTDDWGLEYYVSALPATVAVDGTSYTCEYTGEVSAVKVTNSTLTNESAWVVAFVVEQSVTKAANSLV